MSDKVRRGSYRFFCIVGVVVSAGLLLEMQRAGQMDIKVAVIFVLLGILILWGFFEWQQYSLVIK